MEVLIERMPLISQPQAFHIAIEHSRILEEVFMDPDTYRVFSPFQPLQAII